MARLPRLTVPGLPHHVIQRGNNRAPIVVDDADRRQLLDLFLATSRECKVAVHGYVLMDNHFHLLATPEKEGGLAAMMQAIGRRYVRAFNDRTGRTGTLWEGRYRSTLVQPDAHLLACLAYMDLNPVREGLAADAADYVWSSFRHYAGVAHDRLVTPHPVFWSLGNTPFAREQAYTDLVAAGIAPELQTRITEGTLRGWAVGDHSFLQMLERDAPRRPAPRKPGRPRTARSVPD
jgi:putative transposase